MKRLKTMWLVPALGLMVVAAFAVGCGQGDNSSKNDAQAAATQTERSPTTSDGRQRHRRHRRNTRHRQASTSCPSAGRVLDGVYHPERLEVLNGCKRLRGTAIVVRDEEDGDLHFDVELDQRYREVLLPGNFGVQRGDLVVEFMPRDGGHLPAPSVGDRVEMVGALVNDTQHNWAELHPVWAVRIDGGAWSRSGPQFGGSPAEDRSYNAAASCRTESGGVCAGYGGASTGGPAPHRHRRRSSGGTGSGSGCEPGYNPCLPVAGDLNCDDIPSDKKPVRVRGSDPYGLDRNRDGLGCEG